MLVIAICVFAMYLNVSYVAFQALQSNCVIDIPQTITGPSSKFISKTIFANDFSVERVWFFVVFR